jgi:hypothetical protein
MTPKMPALGPDLEGTASRKRFNWTERDEDSEEHPTFAVFNHHHKKDDCAPEKPPCLAEAEKIGRLVAKI